MNPMQDLLQERESIKIIHDDCLNHMRIMEGNSIDCVLTDPPYGLSFMSKKWDYQLPALEIWQELYRICKPGAPFLCFGGTRTYHRLACLIEDAGFEIRDCIMWIYGSGFPKSHNFGKKLNEDWKGYGTALKPAYEPILVCMKPNQGTFAQNSEAWRVAGINIYDCRIGTTIRRPSSPNKTGIGYKTKNKNGIEYKNSVTTSDWDRKKGRWPANIIFDEAAAKILDEQSNSASTFFYCAKASSNERNAGCEEFPLKKAGIKNLSGRGFSETDPYKEIFMKNNHPTVKPQKLLQYLLKLIMPPNPEAIVLDLFLGSGSTLVAAKTLGYNALGIEKEAEYVEIAKARIK